MLMKKTLFSYGWIGMFLCVYKGVSINSDFLDLSARMYFTLIFIGLASEIYINIVNKKKTSITVSTFLPSVP